MPHRLTALTYRYVEGMAEKRDPYRPGHIELVERWRDDGRLVIAGAIGDPPDGAFIAFSADEAEVERFAAADPYVEAGLVTEHSIRPWTVVAHRPLAD